MQNRRSSQFQRYYLRKKYVHSCKLPKQENIKIEEYYPHACILTRKFIESCLITTDICRRQIYAKSYKVLEKERRKHLENYCFIIHPFSDFKYYWQLLMILLFFVQLICTPLFITLRKEFKSGIYFIFITQIICCINILVNCFTGFYRTDIKEVILDQKYILLNYLKSGNLIFNLLGGFPFPYISYICKAGILNQRLLTCFISFNISALLRYIEIIRQKRGYSFMIFRLLDAFLIFIFGIFWITVLIFVGAHLDHPHQNVKYNVSVWWWVYNTYTFMYGTEVTDFCFVGYEFLFSTVAIIFGILIRNIVLVQLIILCKTWYSSVRKRASLFEELNEFGHYKRLSHDLKTRLKQYYKFKLHGVYYNEADIKNQLSKHLRYNIKDYICRAWFEADIFTLCPLALRQLITIHLEEEIYFKNDVIFRAGEPYDFIYFIKSGSVLRIHEETNKVHEIAEGNFFAEKTLLLDYDEPHRSTVIAMESCQIFKLSKWNFFKIIQNFQPSYSIILDILETRKRFILDGIDLKSRLNLGDYYHRARRFTFSED